MKVTVRRWGAALLAGLVALGGLTPAAQAQFRIPGNVPQVVNPAFNVAPGLQQWSNLYNAAVLGRTIQQIPPYALGYNPYPSPVINTAPVINTGPYGYGAPYSGIGGGYPAASATLSTNPYGYNSTLATTPSSAYGGAYAGGGSYSGYGEDPTAGFLRGTSDVINATGNYYKNVQSARILQTQADDSRIDYRKKLIDEARYERGLMMTTEELRQQQIARDLARSMHQPPIEDITSAKALNDILDHLTSDPARSKGPNIPVDEDVLKRINVTSPSDKNASVGLLKDDGKLQWPQALSGKDFEGPRASLSRKLEDVVQGLKFGNPVEQGKITDLTADLTQLRNAVEKSDLSATDYIDAKSYLDQVGAAILALKDPNVVKNFNHKFDAKNVAELVDGMKGMNFAPAAPGDAWAYKVLHEALVAYDYGVSPNQQAATPPPAH